MAENDKLSSQILKSFAERDISNLSIVEQCRYLEGVYGTDFTGEILDSRLSQRDLQKAILAADKAFRLKDCDTHRLSSTSLDQVFPLSCHGLKFGTWPLTMEQEGPRLLYLSSVPSPVQFLGTDSVHTVHNQ